MFLLNQKLVQITKSNLYDDLEIKKQALKLSPAAFLFMLNNEITFANIIVDYVLS